MEEFRDVIGHEDLFQISNTGILFSKRSNRVLKQNDMNGYLAHVTKIGGRKGRYVVLKIHQLVAKAFIDNPENKYYVNHKDGNKYNNHVDNLEWVTFSENIQHAYDSFLIIHPKGEDVINSKLTEDQISFAKENYIPRNKSFGLRALSRNFGVSHETLRNALSGKTWNHL